MTSQAHEQDVRRQYLSAMGIQLWERRQLAEVSELAGENELAGGRGQEAVMPAVVEQTALTAETSVSTKSHVAAMDWDALQAQVAGCRACSLAESRTQTVFGVGNRTADWMIIGEAPGADEDRQGEPFVGRAGQLLNAMLAAIGLKREQVYIANIVKCRPPNNRNPLAEEASACEPYLLRQIELVKPKMILAVGKVAAANLLKTDAAVGALRGRVHSFGVQAIPLVVTYHPAYLLRAPKEKRKAWHDLQLACKAISEQD